MHAQLTPRPKSSALPPPTPPLRVTTFGEFRCQFNHTLITSTQWRSQRVTQLFLLLISADTHTLTRNHIASQLWPELDQIAASNNVRVSLSRLRQALADSNTSSSLIVADNSRIQLQIPPHSTIDIDEFRLAVKAARRIYDNRTALPHLRHAADVYRGAYLADQPVADWQLTYREQSASEYVEIALRLGRTLLALNLHTELIERMWILLNHDASIEEAHRLLMASYQATGNIEMVRRVYQSCQILLFQQLGMPPQHETTAIYRQVNAV
jgi:DNA-binding SARP family transcriptional activator